MSFIWRAFILYFLFFFPDFRENSNFKRVCQWSDNALNVFSHSTVFCLSDKYICSSCFEKHGDFRTKYMIGFCCHRQNTIILHRHWAVCYSDSILQCWSGHRYSTSMSLGQLFLPLQTDEDMMLNVHYFGSASVLTSSAGAFTFSPAWLTELHQGKIVFLTS